MPIWGTAAALRRIWSCCWEARHSAAATQSAPLSTCLHPCLASATCTWPLCDVCSRSPLPSQRPRPAPRLTPLPCSGVHEVLHMSLAIPLLFGVPPEYERLKRGVIQGGGVIERVQREWIIY